MILTTGKAVEDRGRVWVQTGRPPVENLSDEVTVIWQDCRTISPEQRRKAWALIGEISAFIGEERDSANRDLKREFLMTRWDEMTAAAIQRFSLADTDMTTARMYINFLIDFCLEHDVPTKRPLIELSDDTAQYIYACLTARKCAVCGLKADLHHCEGSAVGMGRNRLEIAHIGLEVMPLCRVHHSECHTIGQARFNQKYHLPGGIPADDKICTTYNLRRNTK